MYADIVKRKIRSDLWLNGDAPTVLFGYPSRNVLLGPKLYEVVFDMLG